MALVLKAASPDFYPSDRLDIRTRIPSKSKVAVPCEYCRHPGGTSITIQGTDFTPSALGTCKFSAVAPIIGTFYAPARYVSPQVASVTPVYVGAGWAGRGGAGRGGAGRGGAGRGGAGRGGAGRAGGRAQ